MAEGFHVNIICHLVTQGIERDRCCCLNDGEEVISTLERLKNIQIIKYNDEKH
jgi:hypothetical protein